MRKAIAATLLVIGVGLGVFFAAQALLVQGTEVPSVEEAVSALENDRLSPRFDGVVAGLRILPRQGEEYAYEPFCSGQQWDEYRGMDPGYVTGTELDIPAIRGLTATVQRVAWCDGQVAFNSVSMVSPDQTAFVDIARVRAEPVLHADVPAGRVREAQLNGRPVIYIDPLRFGDGQYQLSEGKLYIVEDFGITAISVEGPVDIFDVAAQVVEGSR